MASTLSSIVSHIDQLLEIQAFVDYGINGLQVDSGRSEIQRIAFAVDSGLSVIEEAVRLRADLLIVHHGLFWGKCLPMTGPLGKKVRNLMSGGCSLYAAHLPLDGHIEIGNAAQLAKFLGAKNIEPYFLHNGRAIGVKAALPALCPLDEIEAKLKNMLGAPTKMHIFPFGKKVVKTLGIVTGSGSALAAECKASELDLFISGEPKHEVFHTLKELELSAIFAGHYATETFGVRELRRILEERFRVETHFIDQPSDV